MSKEKKRAINILKDIYNLSDDTPILVGSNKILKQFSFLNRHMFGNEDRIKKIAKLIESCEEENQSSFPYNYELTFEQLMELYDISKNVDHEKVREILNRNEEILRQEIEDENFITRILPNNLIKPVEKVESEKYILVNDVMYSLQSGSRYRIGRDDSNAIIIFDTTVSRNHCEIHMRKNKIWILDLKSRNGTYVNNERVEREYQIDVGDEIVIGTCKIYIKEREERK